MEVTEGHRTSEVWREGRNIREEGEECLITLLMNMTVNS